MIDNNMPKFLRYVAETSRAGLTLTRAFEMASQEEYGPLTEELRRMNAQLSWGTPLTEAIQSLSDRLGTRLARRTCALLVDVVETGGGSHEVLETVNRHIGDLQIVDKERMSQIKPYMAIVYIAVTIFLFIDVVLLRTFFSQLSSLQIESAAGLPEIVAQGPDIDAIKRILFHTAIIQSFFGGMIAGKMGEGSLGAGLKHTLILMSLTFLVFLLLVWR